MANWDTITAEKLNNMEDGISENGEGNVFIIHATAINNDGTWEVTADSTWSEITSAYTSNKAVILKGTINPNDGRPEDYYYRYEFIVSNYVSSSLIGFVYNDVNNYGITTHSFTLSFNDSWQYSQVSRNFSI